MALILSTTKHLTEVRDATKRLIEHLERENADLKAQVRGLLNTTFAVQGLPSPFAAAVEEEPELPPRLTWDQAVNQWESEARAATDPPDA